MIKAAATRVLLALSSSLVRMRLKHSLAIDSSIWIVGEAAEGVSAAELAQRLDPHIIICDERMLAEPSLVELFTDRRHKATCRVVLVAANSRGPARAGPVPIAGVLAIDLPSEDLVLRLHGAMEVDLEPPPAPAPQRVTGMEHRFVIVEQRPPAAAADGPGATAALGGQTRLFGGLGDRASLTTGPISAPGRREGSPALDQLAAYLTTVQLSPDQQQRDSVTGLANTRALGMALRALPRLNHPSAVVVVDIWYGDEMTLPGATTQRVLLRSAAAAIRANSRQEDLVCRLDGLTFAVLMPGLDRGSAAAPLQRLRHALCDLRLTSDEAGAGPAVIVGVGFWEPGLPPAHPLERAWRSVKAERDNTARP